MLTLFINTSASLESLALWDKQKILAEKTWNGKNDESEVLLGNLTQLIKKAKKPLTAIKRIIAVCGPGPYSAVRIGVSVANMLAFALKAKLFSVDSRILWGKRAPEAHSICLLHAGGNYVLRLGGKKSAKILPIEEALSLATFSSKLLQCEEKDLVFYGDITDNEMQEFKKFQMQHPEWKFVPAQELQSAAETLIQLPQNFLQAAHIITPLYLRPPFITQKAK